MRNLLDPACGTGGMLAEAQNYMREHHAAAKLYVYGQDYNKRAFATAASDMLMKQVDHNGGGENIRFGDSFHRGPVRGTEVRLLPRQSALRRGLEEAAEGDLSASTKSWASRAASAPGCRASTTARCCSSST